MTRRSFAQWLCSIPLVGSLARLCMAAPQACRFAEDVGWTHVESVNEASSWARKGVLPPTSPPGRRLGDETGVYWSENETLDGTYLMLAVCPHCKWWVACTIGKEEIASAMVGFRTPELLALYRRMAIRRVRAMGQGHQGYHCPHAEPFARRFDELDAATKGIA